MLRIGTITEIDVSKCYARVTFMDDDIVSDWLQICVMGALSNKFFHMFDINEQVACLMDEHSDDGVILGALFNDKTPPAGGNKDVVRVQFSDDSFVEYNRATHEYNINVKGTVNIVSEGETRIEAQTVTVDATMVSIDAEMVDVQATAVTMSGTLTVTGALTAASLTAASGSITGGGMTAEGGNLEVTGDVTAEGEVSGASVVAGTINLATHVHAGVETGGGSTAPPTP
jgi:phage baseplate assembly protein V